MIRWRMVFFWCAVVALALWFAIAMSPGEALK